MKWYIYLFSLYLLTLSGFTCKADSECCKDNITGQASSGHHEDDHNEHSACVPFLACGACNSILPYNTSVEMHLSNSTVPKAAFHYLETIWSNSPGWIWQPPKIA